MEVGIVDGSMVLGLGNWIIVSFIKIWIIERRGTALEGSNVYIFSKSRGVSGSSM